jgi:hypothetical protein
MSFPYRSNYLSKSSSQHIQREKATTSPFAQHEGMGRGGGIDLLILNRHISWKRVVSSTPWLINTQYPLHRRLGDPQKQHEHLGREKNPSPLLEIEQLFKRPAHSLLSTIMIMF